MTRTIHRSLIRSWKVSRGEPCAPAPIILTPDHVRGRLLGLRDWWDAFTLRPGHTPRTRFAPPLSFGHFPRERGKPDPALITLTLTLSHRGRGNDGVWGSVEFCDEVYCGFDVG